MTNSKLPRIILTELQSERLTSRRLTEADASMQAANEATVNLKAQLTDKEVQITNLAQELSAERKSKTAVEQQLGAMEWQNSKLCSELTEVTPAVSVSLRPYSVALSVLKAFYTVRY